MTVDKNMSMMKLKDRFVTEYLLLPPDQKYRDAILFRRGILKGKYYTIISSCI